MKTLKRKSRSDKFPLTLHPTGQYCKKVKEKYITSALTKKWRFKDIWIRQLICMDIQGIYKNQQAII